MRFSGSVLAFYSGDSVGWGSAAACWLLQMILKFFDIFLKMKDMTSSEAFMVRACCG